MDHYTAPKQNIKDKTLNSALRPKTWDDYIGQKKIKKSIKIIIEAAQKRQESPDHLLLYGGSGLGKTSLSCLIAEEMGVGIRMISGPSIERPGDLAAILTNIAENEILFIDEFHRINKVCEEYLYSALEDFKLNIILGKGPMAKTMELNLPRFTLIGATTRIALLSAPLRNRFGATFRLNFYKEKDIEEIIKRSAAILEIEAESEAIKIMAKCSRYTPRSANRILKRTRDFAQIEGKGIITKKITEKSLESLEIDEIGLEPGDRKIIKTIIEKFEGGPVGLQALSSASSEEQDAILDIYEPYLMKFGLIKRTPRGRVATKLAYQHLKITSPQKILF